MAGKFTTDQQQAAMQYILSFPRVAGWVKKACQGQGDCWMGSCFQWLLEARFVSCNPHNLLKDVKHIQRMSVATNENKAQHTAIWLPTGIKMNPNTWQWLNCPPPAGHSVIFVKQGLQQLRKNNTVTWSHTYIFQSQINFLCQFLTTSDWNTLD